MFRGRDLRHLADYFANPSSLTDATGGCSRVQLPSALSDEQNQCEYRFQAIYATVLTDSFWPHSVRRERSCNSSAMRLRIAVLSFIALMLPVKALTPTA